MGRRELRAELESTWVVLEPRVPGTPFRAKDIHDAYERPVLESAAETSVEPLPSPGGGASPSAADSEVE